MGKGICIWLAAGRPMQVFGRVGREGQRLRICVVDASHEGNFRGSHGQRRFLPLFRSSLGIRDDATRPTNPKKTIKITHTPPASKATLPPPNKRHLSGENVVNDKKRRLGQCPNLACTVQKHSQDRRTRGQPQIPQKQ